MWNDIVQTAVLTDGRRLMGIVIPDDATEAEQYAAVELRKYVHKMTGCHLQTGSESVVPAPQARLGRAVGDTLERLDGLPEDSYLVGAEGGNILLAGNNGRGTLYAVYDFLKQQGCGWYMPGPLGEVVTRRKSLSLPGPVRIEAPDYQIRGLDAKRPSHYLDGPKPVDIEAVADWCVRNRLNAMHVAYFNFLDFGAHRGGSHTFITNHSIGGFWKDNPEFAPIVDGKPALRHMGGWLNMPCTSNEKFRDHVTKRVLEMFRQFPKLTSVALNLDDGHKSWCECKGCRAQDHDGGKGKWVRWFPDSPGYGTVPFPMTDRHLNFVNDVAERVAKVHPDKLIEMHVTPEINGAPKREHVHPNVRVKHVIPYAYSPLGRSCADASFPPAADMMASLKGWREAGATDMWLFDSDVFRRGSPICTAFYDVADRLRVMHRQLGFNGYLPIQMLIPDGPSHMMHYVRTQLLWDTKADYREAIREACGMLYGNAAKSMRDYYRHMDECILRYWRDPEHKLPYWYNQRMSRHEVAGAAGQRMEEGRLEYTWADMREGARLLDEASPTEHVALVRFGHALASVVMALESDKVQRDTTPADVIFAKQEWELAKDMRRAHDFPCTKAVTELLSWFYVAPQVEEKVMDLPLTWQWRMDGAKAWKKISVRELWTDQPIGAGRHGIGWYRLDYKFPKSLNGCALWFAGVDGQTDVFVDGKNIGENKGPPGAIWLHQFALKLPRPKKGKHRIEVRVEKPSMGAGIWHGGDLTKQRAPVQIVRLRGGA